MEYLREWVDKAPTMAEYNKRLRIMQDERNREQSTTYILGAEEVQNGE